MPYEPTHANLPTWLQKTRCCMQTLAGKPCTQPTYAKDLPCCFNHVHAWVAESFDNLRRFLTPRAHRVARAWTSVIHNTIIIEVHKQVGPCIPFRLNRPNPHKGFTGIRLPGDTAYVVADLLDSLGNREAAEHIIQTQDKLNT